MSADFNIKIISINIYTMVRKFYRKKRGGRSGNLDKRIARIARKVTQQEAELKFIDTDYNASTPVSGTSVVLPITLIPGGDTPSSRDGNEVKIHSLSMHGKIQTHVDVDNDELCRLMIIQVYECDAVLPVVADFLIDDSCYSQPNWIERGKYRILSDKVMRIPISMADSITKKPVKFYKRFKRPIKITFNSEASTIAAAENNHFFALLCTDTGGANLPGWTLNFRATFTDS